MALQLILCTAIKQIFIKSGSQLMFQSRKIPREVEKHAALPLKQKQHLSASGSEHHSPEYW